MLIKFPTHVSERAEHIKFDLFRGHLADDLQVHSANPRHNNRDNPAKSCLPSIGGLCAHRLLERESCRRL